MGRRVSIYFKSLNGIEISWLIQVLLNFYWFQGSPPLWGGGWVNGVGWIWVHGECPSMHAHTHMCTHAHTHIHVKHDKHGCLHVGGHLQFLCMYTCLCLHVHMCGQTSMAPNAPRYPPPTCSLPRPAGSSKQQNSISPELIKIIQFCLKIWDPWTLLHTYRLGLMCRWGVSYPKWHFYVFDPKKCSRDPKIKFFPVSGLDPITPYLDWALRGFLTS